EAGLEVATAIGIVETEQVGDGVRILQPEVAEPEAGIDFGGVGTGEAGRIVARVVVVIDADVPARRVADLAAKTGVEVEFDTAGHRYADAGEIRQPADAAAPGPGVEAAVGPFDAGLDGRIAVALGEPAKHIVAGQRGGAAELPRNQRRDGEDEQQRAQAQLPVHGITSGWTAGLVQ